MVKRYGYRPRQALQKRDAEVLCLLHDLIRPERALYLADMGFAQEEHADAGLAEAAADYEVMLPVHAEGTEACLPRNMDIIEFGAALTTDNRDIEASLRWLDAQFETETMLVSQNGAVGDTLEKREDSLYQVKYVPPDNELYQSVPVICGQFFAPADYYASVYVPAAHRLEKAAYCDLYERSGVLEPISATLLTTVAPKTTDQSAETTRLKAKLKSLVDAEIVSMVTQGVTEEGRAAFRESLKAGGSADYRQVYQQIYDRWKEK